jgi:hypothetical protein
MEEKIKEISTEFINAISEYTENQIKILSFEIDCNELQKDFGNQHICDSPYFIKNFNELKLIEKKPTIYWFEFDGQTHNCESLYIFFKEHKENFGNSNLPAIYKQFRDTNVLYLGKSKTYLWGRLLQHLGFHDDTHSQGLILKDWTSELNIKLTFKYIVFNEKMSDLITMYELKLAQQMKPLIGKHR